MKPSKQADLNKLSHLIRAGATVHTIDGGVYRCTAKFASEDGINFHLADLQGKPVQTPNFYPISSRLARFAAWMRYVVAYNKDFDMYVKEYIKSAGLPVDPTMNWSKFFQAKIVPKLISKDSDIQDEAIHQIIVKALAERSVLMNFNSAIGKFPARIRELPLERQVTVFLMQTFNWRIIEANEYIRKYVFQEDADSMWGTEPSEEEGDVNLLDTKDNVGGMEGYSLAEADADVERFRRGFETYLKEKKGLHASSVEQYLTLFDIVYEEVKASADVPRLTDVALELERQLGEGGVKKSPAWFKILFSNLPKLIDDYITRYLDKLHYHVHPFLEIMRRINRNREEVEKSRLVPAMASLTLADEEEEEKPSGIRAAVGAIGDVVSGVAELAPMLAAAQWEVPKCKACGSSIEPKECLGCHEKFCMECTVNHHSNNPSHRRIATKTADTLPEGYQNGYRSGQADRNIGTPFLDVNKTPGASEYSRGYCQGYYDGYHGLKFKSYFAGTMR